MYQTNGSDSDDAKELLAIVGKDVIATDDQAECHAIVTRYETKTRT